jgi:hypothetical protein
MAALNPTDFPERETAMFEITEPLRLAVGSHRAGSGKGCAMNVVSWESGDTTITDLPACTDPMLARLVQHVNDHYCTHRDGDLLCPPCSVDVLGLAHRTVGTGSTGLSDAALKRVWVRIACANDAAANSGFRSYNPAARLRMAHKAVDRFAELTGHVEQAPEPAAVACAVDAMRVLA